MNRFLILFGVLLTNLLAATTMQNNPVVTLNTTLGSIQLTLRPDVAPKACENFIGLCKKGYYNDVIFHRVIKDFMIQGGDPTGTGRGGQSIWEQNFADEYSPELKFDRPGLLAMANRGPSTNGSQFFITCAATPWLNNKHTIFGQVTQGMDVVQKIENCEKDSQDRPKTPVKILSATVQEPQTAAS